MKETTIIGACVAAFLAIVVGLTTLSWYNTAVQLDNGVRAQWQENQNSYDAFWKKVKETAQVPDRFKDDFKEILLGAVDKRYAGKDPAVSFITEQNPGLPSDMYVQVQRVIEAGRNEFRTSQTSLLDRQRKYKNHLETGMGVFLSFSHPREITGTLKPPRDQDGDGKFTSLDYPIVTSSQTQEAFATGAAEELNVFGRK